MNSNLKKVVMVVALMAAVPAANAGGFLSDFIENLDFSDVYMLEGQPHRIVAPLSDSAQFSYRLGVFLNHYCATPNGIANVPWAPVGTSCQVNDVPGVIVL